MGGEYLKDEVTMIFDSTFIYRESSLRIRELSQSVDQVVDSTRVKNHYSRAVHAV
jgi:hypothetical protein